MHAGLAKVHRPWVEAQEHARSTIVEVADLVDLVLDLQRLPEKGHQRITGINHFDCHGLMPRMTIKVAADQIDGRPVDLVAVDVAGPVRAVPLAQVLHVREQGSGPRAVAERVERQHQQLTGLRSGDPGLGVDAAHPQAGDHEVVPPGVDQVPARHAADGAAEHRVVPVHRVRRLVEEPVAVLAQRVPEPARGELPLGLGVVEEVGQGEAGPQGVVDAGRAGQQRLAVDRGRPALVPLLGPGDPPERQLQTADVVEGAPDGRPVGDHEAELAAYQPVVPHADGDVRRHVRLAAGVLDDGADDLHRPRPVGALRLPHPGPRAVHRLDPAGHEEGHGRLDVVPDVGVTADRPGDRAARLLYGLDRRAGGSNVGRSQELRRHRRAPACGGTPPGSCRAPGSGHARPIASSAASA